MPPPLYPSQSYSISGNLEHGDSHCTALFVADLRNPCLGVEYSDTNTHSHSSHACFL